LQASLVGDRIEVDSQQRVALMPPAQDPVSLRDLVQLRQWLAVVLMALQHGGQFRYRAAGARAGWQGAGVAGLKDLVMQCG